MLCLLLLVAFVQGIVPADELKSIPGLKAPMPARLWSGYLKVDGSKIPGGQTFYSHYLLAESTREGGGLLKDPLVLWQQGGPGSSGMAYGFFAEFGPYILDADSIAANPDLPEPRVRDSSVAWTSVANILIFEHPPGTGFSYCEDAHGQLVTCQWNDQTQAVAFYETLLAFYAKWDEFKGKPLRAIGESYAGLLVPFLVDQIAKNEPNNPFKFVASALGNGCPGTSGASPTNRGACNGPYGTYATESVTELAFGHSGAPRALYEAVRTACGFPCDTGAWDKPCYPYSSSCEEKLHAFSEAVGPFNIYNFYDNCGDGNQMEGTSEWLMSTENTSTFYGTLSEHRARLEEGQRHSGGNTYPCGTGRAALQYMNIPSVRAAWHMKPQSFYKHPWTTGECYNGKQCNYTTYTGSSFDLYKSEILHKYHALVYNGDVDACVPYNANEAWVGKLGLAAASPWRPWVVDRVPAGYVSEYLTSGPGNFTFITIKGAGHMVPQYQAKRARAFFERWLAGGPF